MSKEQQESWEYDFINELIDINKKHCPRFAAKMITKILFVITDDDENDSK